MVTLTRGTTLYKNIDVDESEDAVKTSPGTLRWLHAYNANAAALHLKFYDALIANITVGTTVPSLTFTIPATSAISLDFSDGIEFSTAISVAATTGVADNDSGAPGANEVILAAGYA